MVDRCNQGEVALSRIIDAMRDDSGDNNLTDEHDSFMKRS
jgi:hypothetical protein